MSRTHQTRNASFIASAIIIAVFIAGVLFLIGRRTAETSSNQDASTLPCVHYAGQTVGTFDQDFQFVFCGTQLIITLPFNPGCEISVMKNAGGSQCDEAKMSRFISAVWDGEPHPVRIDAYDSTVIVQYEGADSPSEGIYPITKIARDIFGS